MQVITDVEKQRVTYKALPLLGPRRMKGVLKEGQNKISWSMLRAKTRDWNVGICDIRATEGH